MLRLREELGEELVMLVFMDDLLLLIEKLRLAALVRFLKQELETFATVKHAKVYVHGRRCS